MNYDYTAATNKQFVFRPDAKKLWFPNRLALGVCIPHPFIFEKKQTALFDVGDKSDGVVSRFIAAEITL